MTIRGLGASGAFFFWLLAAAPLPAALAADLGPGPYPGPYPGPGGGGSPGGDRGYAYAPPRVYDAVDARCRIVPNPQLDLVGDTARFRPTAVCLSRGLYADSLGFPQAPVLYGPLR
ncbi:hypothetical protein [Methylocapsa palsarum]|uniref:Uncharacterized protein n=1 Tax=Methylocapsa palsarum TaxID=1612308 RepID=A0A1I3YLW2_9HYPH|nr:hypothetical protein [Methylocapsa palsarum]SFK32858.1 hypothetical protein SAMN05444581_10638 [Methylocapsa palsarum]